MAKGVKFMKPQRLYLKFKTIGESQVVQNFFYDRLNGFVNAVLKRADPEYQKRYHLNGSKYGQRPYRLYSYSSFFSPQMKRLHSVEFYPPDSDMEWIVSTADPEFSKNFVEGLADEIKEGNGIIQLSDFRARLVDIQEVNAPIHNNKFVTLSPFVFSRRIKPGNHTRYCTDEKEINELLPAHLARKWHALTGEKIENPDISVRFRDVRPVKRYFRDKDSGHTNAIIANQGHIEFLTDDERILNLIYYAGFGLRGSTGYGCLEVMPLS